MQPLRSSHGFSLVEVITTLGVIGVLYTVAAPAVSTWRQKVTLISAQREMMSALYRARGSAIAGNTPRRVVVSPPASIRVTDISGATTYYADSLDPYGSGIRIATYRDYDYDDDHPIIVTYDARGLLNPPTTVTLRLQDRTGESRTITVYPTGKPVAN